MVDLVEYTGISRKGRIIKYENRSNEYPFPTEEEAEKFEKLYNSLAVEALKEVMSIIKKHKDIVRNAEKLSEEDLAFHAGEYFRKSIPGVRAPTLGGIEKKANRLYELSKDINLLKRLDLI